MKNSFFMFFLAGIALFALQSCQKAERVAALVEKTVNATLKVNESYTFTLPSNQSDDPYQITTQASHSSISELGKNTAGDMVYNYTPALDFAGTDMVVITTVEETHTGTCGNHDGHHDGEHHDDGDSTHVDGEHHDDGDSTHVDGEHHDGLDLFHHHGHHQDEAETEMKITLNLTIAGKTQGVVK